MPIVGKCYIQRVFGRQAWESSEGSRSPRFLRSYAVGLAVLFGALACTRTPGLSADWPMWRYDAGRTAASPEELPTHLTVRWVRELPPPKAAWPWDQYRLQFDASYEPVAAGDSVIIASMVRDSVIAYDAASGRERWRFYADAPVRFAPVIADGRLYFSSDDSRLYCLNPTDGSLVFSFDPVPLVRRVLGNDRMISTWPARGAPVVANGVVYFAAGIWPFMGTFIYALDAATGKVIWENSGSGAMYLLQPHNSPAFAGVAPQGYLVAVGDALVVPGGRSVPATYDLATGAFRYYHGNTKEGDFAVAARGEWFINAGSIYRLTDGEPLCTCNATVLAEGEMYGLGAQGQIIARALRTPDEKIVTKTDKRGEKYNVTEYSFPELWRLDTRLPLTRVQLRAGSRLYASGEDGLIAAVRIPSYGEQARVCWQSRVEGDVWSMIAANGRLFVVTKQGRLYCFAEPHNGPVPPLLRDRASPFPLSEELRTQAAGIMHATGIRDGYALVVGIGAAELAAELARQSRLHVIALEQDAKRTQISRRKLDDAGLYGRRVAVLAGEPVSAGLPPYFASLAVWQNFPQAGTERLFNLFRCLRPYGGTLCVPQPVAEALNLRETVGLIPGARIRNVGNWVLVSRAGPLDGAGSWTHQYGDVANSVTSTDRLVRTPLGLLWFGGPSNLEVLPRHGHGPSPQVVGGRLFIQGVGVFSARDAYTGRVIWSREFPDLNTFGAYYDETYNPDPFDRSYNQVHIPGANEVGSNFVTTPDRVYLVAGPLCHVLDPATGETLADFSLNIESEDQPMNWGYIGVYKDLLIATAEPVKIAEDQVTPNARFAAQSRHLVVMDRHTGEVLWTRRAVYSFRHNAIVAGGGKIFCIDGLTKAKLDLMKRRGTHPAQEPQLLALDAYTGEPAWTTNNNVFGTWLGYSGEYDVLLQAGSKSNDRAEDEADAGMVAYRGADGTVLWQHHDAYLGPPVLHHDRIITQVAYGSQRSTPAQAYDLLTGKQSTCVHPITSETVPWSWVRFYGCNTAVASEHLLIFRSAAASVVDLTRGQGTTSLGGFRAGCTSNLIVADGVLSAPDYTRTCICSYQNQSSLALVHDEAVEAWAFDHYPPPLKPTPVTRIGLNLGAPGNRMSDEGTLFIEVPSVGGPSPDIPVRWSGDKPGWFRRHSVFFRGALPWVGASGLQGAGTLIVRPFIQPVESPSETVEGYLRNAFTSQIDAVHAPQGAFEPPRSYTVRLYFAEPSENQSGPRVFSVALQGREVLNSFDIAAAAGGPCVVIAKEFRGVPVSDDLSITLTPAPATHAPPLLCGVELLAE